MSEATITYRNIFRDEKDISDYRAWLDQHWPLQRSWGAMDYELWQEELDVICCRYKVRDIDAWNRRSSGPEAEELVNSLSRIVNLNRVSLKIAFSGHLPA